MSISDTASLVIDPLATRQLASVAPAPGMQVLNLARSEKIPVLMELVGAVSRATDPLDVQRAFRRGFRKIYRADGYVSLSTRGLEPGQYKITRLVTDFAQEDDSHNPWAEFARMPVHQGGVLGELIRSAFPQVIHHLQVRHDPVLGGALAPFGSLMAIPLFDDGEPLNWAISLRKSPTGFSLEDVEDAILRGNLAGGQVRNVLIAKQLREANQRIAREMERIATIQKALLPDKMPQIPGARVAASYATFDQAGGDMYLFRRFADAGDARSAEDPRWGLMIADVSGHGPSAAVVMAMVHAIVHAYPHTPRGTAEVVSHLNAHLCAKRIENSFTTAFFAIYDPTTRALTYTRAGHNPPLIKEAGPGSPTIRLEEAGSVPLGVLDDTVFEEHTVTLKPHQTLVMYTDGVTEAMNPARRMFGTDGVERALIECSGEPECVVQSITTALKAHEAGVRPADDQTIVALRIDA
jgi:phosphoserine phosphatase RsbU/P